MSIGSGGMGAPMRGFTLIEILVTLVILTIGMLGVAGLMAQGQRASFEAYQRQQALALATDMAERIKANRPGADTGVVATTYDAAVPESDPPVAGNGALFKDLAGGTTTNCATTDCTPEQLVAYDAALWDGLLTGAAAERDRASGDAIALLLKPRGCVRALPLPAGALAACPACPSPPTSRQVTHRVSVAWQGNSATFPPAAADACGLGEYNDPRTGLAVEAFRRLVSVDVYTIIPCVCP